MLKRRIEELEAVCTRSSEAETVLHERTSALAERVKELRCLYEVSQLLEDRQISQSAILQRIAETLPAAWQYPDVACARVCVDSETYQTLNFGESSWAQRNPIVVRGAERGFVEILYLEQRPEHDEGAFLAEERSLLGVVADRIADIIDLKASEQNLSSYQDQLRSLALELTLTEERERRHIALGIHDRIGHVLAVAKLKLESLMEATRSPEMARKVDDICILLKQAIDDTRSLSFEISPPILYELGLYPAVCWLAEHFDKRFELHTTVDSDRLPVSLSDGISMMLFRAVHELLTNVVKHANASNVRISLAVRGELLRIQIQDDGVGFDVARWTTRPGTSAGFGLFSIRERLEHLGGRFEIASRPDNGTTVVLTMTTADHPQDAGIPRHP